MSETDDEIDLIDLFAILVKWRKSIIKLMIFFIAVITVVLYVAPFSGLVSFDSFLVRASAVPVQLPPTLKAELAIDPLKMAATIASDNRVVIEALEESGYASEIYIDNDRKGWEYQSFIKDSFIGKAYQVDIEESIFSLELQTKKPQEAKAFLESIYGHIDQQMRKLIASKSEVIARSLEGLYATGADNSALSEPVKQLIISSNVYAKGDFSAFEFSSEPDIYIEKKSTIMMFIVSTFASFFASILIVFIAEAFNNIRNDPVSSEKILSAMRERPSIRKTLNLKHKGKK